MSVRLVLGHIDQLDASVLAFGQQLGLSGVQLHTPSNLSSQSGHWELDELVALRQRCEEAGLALEGLENVPLAHWDKVLTGRPGRDEQLEHYKTTIRNMGSAGIPVLGHHFLPGYVWRTQMRARGRGGAVVTAYDEADVGAGNALASYKLTPAAPLEPIDAEQMWESYGYFLQEVLPVAESAGVRLALHPDDPPTQVALGGPARILSSPEGLERAYDLSGGSVAWGLNLCLGSVSEMAGETTVNRVIDFFGPRGKIVLIHFRDVRGVVPRFEECFLGEGNYDPVAVLRRLADVGFDGFIIDDHVPAMVGDPDTWGDTSPEAYCSRGRAYALGYLQGVLQALGLG